ncbi:MAG: hypothetical protein AAF960_07615 [Bacteroidota bacterium]
MDETAPNDEQLSKKKGNKMVDKATETYKWWNNLATLNPQDSIGLTIAKIGIRVLGVIVLIALSPIAIVAIIIGFLTVL